MGRVKHSHSPKTTTPMRLSNLTPDMLLPLETLGVKSLIVIFYRNEITNSDNLYGPPDSAYQTARNRYHWRTTLNWSPPQGTPNVGLFTCNAPWNTVLTSVKYLPNPNEWVKLTGDNATDYYKAHPLQT